MYFHDFEFKDSKANICFKEVSLGWGKGELIFFILQQLAINFPDR